MKKIPHLKFIFSTTILLLILIVSFSVRVNLLDYPFENGEAHRDYLVSHNIAKYNEVALIGPNNDVFNTKNSSAYYYFLSLFLLIEDNIIFLGYVNVLLQIVNILIVFILAQKMFGFSTALFSAFFFGFSGTALRQSLYAWQPYIMQPFVNLAYLLLLLSFIYKKFPLTLLAAATLLFAGALYQSAYSVVPGFIAVAFIMLRAQGSKINKFALALVLLLVIYYTYLILNLNTFRYLQNSGVDILAAVTKKFISSPNEFINNLLTNTSLLADTIFSGIQDDLIKTKLVIILALGSVYYTFYRKDIRRIYVTTIFLAIMTSLVFASLLDTKMFDMRFTQIYALFVILSFAAVTSITEKVVKNRVGKIICLVLLLIACRAILVEDYLINEKISSNLETINFSTEAIKKEVLNIKTEKSYENVNFFQIAVIKVGYTSKVNEPLIFWTALEESFDTKFTAVSDISGNNLKLINNDDYIFLICNSNFGFLEDEDCKKEFLASKQTFSVLENIYQQYPLSIYLTKKSNN